MTTRPSAAAVVCNDLCYVYANGTVANRGIDLEIGPGEVVCLLGPNGAGKTTLIRQVTTELRPSSGRVVICGEDAHRDPIRAKARLGVVPQAASLYATLSVEEHLAYFGPLKQLTRTATSAAVERMLDLCELHDLRRRRIGELSTGQQRKVLLALALLADPQILVLDEPTVGLDPLARRMVWDIILNERAAGKSVLLTTHYMEEAERLADRVGFLDGGALACLGTLEQLRMQLGKSVRVTQCDETSGAPLAQHFFDSLEAAEGFMKEAGFRAYSVGRVSLEDIYLRLTGRWLEGRVNGP